MSRFQTPAAEVFQILYNEMTKRELLALVESLVGKTISPTHAVLLRNLVSSDPRSLPQLRAKWERQEQKWEKAAALRSDPAAMQAEVERKELVRISKLKQEELEEERLRLGLTPQEWAQRTQRARRTS